MKQLNQSDKDYLLGLCSRKRGYKNERIKPK